LLLPLLLLLLSVSLLFAPVGVAAQSRDTARTPAGAGSISGVVMSTATPGKPIRRAIVTLGGATGRLPIAAITDDNGAFQFPNLAEGAYTLVATRAAYVSSAYGAKVYGRGSGVPISVGPGQHVTGLVIRMLHGSVIAGTVRDATGRPSPGVELILLSIQSSNNKRRVTPVLQQGRTDNRGEYRVYGLAPGDYIVRAQPNTRFGETLRPTTPAEVEWARAAAVKSGASADVATAAAPPATGRPVAYAPTYYPGTPESAQAAVVTLGPDEERTGVDFSTMLVPVASLSGTVMGPDGQPPRGAQVQLIPASGSGSGGLDTLLGMAGAGASARVSPDGRLSASGIAPGRYRLIVRGSPGGGAEAGRQAPQGAGALAATVAAGMFGGSGARGPRLWAVEDLTIDGRDITGLNVQLQAGMTLSGTIVFEGEDPQSPPDASRVMVMVNDAERESRSALDMLAGMMQGTSGGGTKDRTFSVSGLAPGTYRATFSPPGVMPMFGMTGPVGGWALKSAMLDGVDLADSPFEIKSGKDVTGVVATFTKTSTEVSGHLQDVNGRPASGFPIVVFSTDRTRWTAGARRILSAKPASDGSYKISGLPAGEYYLCAVTDLDPNDLYDPAFLDQLVAGSFKITLADGEKKIQDLKLGGGTRP
jgi:hypothetical protein